MIAIFYRSYQELRLSHTGTSIIAKSLISIHSETKTMNFLNVTQV